MTVCENKKIYVFEHNPHSLWEEAPLLSNAADVSYIHINMNINENDQYQKTNYNNYDVLINQIIKESNTTSRNE